MPPERFLCWVWKPLWSDLQGAQIRDQRFSICSQTRKETSAASAGVRACILENKSLKADPAAAHPGVEARQRAMVGAPPRLAAPPWALMRLRIPIPRRGPRRARRTTAPPTAPPPGTPRHAPRCATRRSRRQAHRVSCCDHSRTYGCSATPSHRPTHISTQGVSEHHQSLKVSKSQSLKISESQSLRISCLRISSRHHRRPA